MYLEVKGFTKEDIAEVERKRGKQIVNGNGEYFEVVAVKLFVDRIADLDNAYAVNVFGTLGEATAFAAKMNAKEVDWGVDQSKVTMHVVKARQADWML